jgi:hypothetical protein
MFLSAKLWPITILQLAIEERLAGQTGWEKAYYDNIEQLFRWGLGGDIFAFSHLSKRVHCSQNLADL